MSEVRLVPSQYRIGVSWLADITALLREHPIVSRWGVTCQKQILRQDASEQSMLSQTLWLGRRGVALYLKAPLSTPPTPPVANVPNSSYPLEWEPTVTSRTTDSDDSTSSSMEE